MKRILVAAMPVIAAAALVAGPAMAAQRVTCQQIQAALASGKKVSEVAKELKVSTHQVQHCKAAAMSASSGTSKSSSSKSH